MLADWDTHFRGESTFDSTKYCDLLLTLAREGAHVGSLCFYCMRRFRVVYDELH